jgi:hypothetical protein
MDQFQQGVPKTTTVCIGTSYMRALPYAHVACNSCKRLWSMSDSHTASAVYERKLLALDMFIGLTLAELKAYFAQFHDAHYEMLLPVVVVNQNNESAPVEDLSGYVVQAGDQVRFGVKTYMHQECQLKERTFAAKAGFDRAINFAGFTSYGAVRIPNLWGTAWEKGSWFIYDTDHGYMRLGWRRQVLAYHPVKLTGYHQFEEFGEEMHFDNYEDLSAYLKTI